MRSQSTEQVQGPLVSDELFFKELLDLSLPELAEVAETAEVGDYKAAKRAFAAHVRQSLQPERYFQIANPSVSRGFKKNDEESLEDAAERILRLELVSSGTPHRFENEVDWFANPTANQYREWTWQLNRHMDFIILARRYMETGEEKFAEGWVNLFRSWVRQAVRPPAGVSAYQTKSWRTIEAGIRMLSSWPFALHAFYKSVHFTDDVLIDWYKSVWEHGERLRNNYQIGNWLIMEMNGLAHIGLLYPEFKTSREWREFAIHKLKDELTVQIYPDGFQFELSTGYHQIVTQYGMIANMYEVYGQSVPQSFQDTLEKAYAVNLKMMMPDRRLPNVNDGSWMDVSSSMQTAVRHYPHRNDFRWIATRGKEGRPPAETSLSLPYAGYCVMRTGWEEDAVWGLLDAGPFGRAHQHEDKLNLLIHAYGAMLLTEGGNYAYDDSEMRRYVLSTRSHNTVRVDGQDQNRRYHYKWLDDDIKKEAGLKWHSDSKVDIAEGSYEEGYGEHAEIKVKHGRKVIFMKEHARLDPCFVVIDRFYPLDDQMHLYEILWHFDSDDASVKREDAASNAGDVANQGLSVISTAQNGVKLAVLPASSKMLSLEIVKGQTEPEWQGWKSLEQGMQGEYGAIPTAVYTLAASAPVRQVTVLYPVKPGEECPVVDVTASNDVMDTRIELKLSDGEIVKLEE